MHDFELWIAADEGVVVGLTIRDEWVEAARAGWIAALNRAIEVMPGGSVVDPQWVCDKLRELGGTRGG